MHRGLKNSDRHSLLDGYSAVLGGALMRHRVEVAERAKRVEAERANEIISQFIANMSHELRTPLNAIIGFSKFMQDVDKYQLSEDKIKEYSGFIYDGSVNLLEIINEILEFSKLQSGDGVDDVQDIAMAEMLDSSIAMWCMEDDTTEPLIYGEYAGDLPIIKADLHRVKQVFSNILQNALKRLPDGRQIKVSACVAVPEFICISISDMEASFSTDDVLDGMIPFSKANADFSEVEKGAGLGLSITNALIDSLGGSLAIFRNLSVGTAVAVTLPLDRNTATPVPVPGKIKTTESANSPVVDKNRQTRPDDQIDVFEVA